MKKKLLFIPLACLLLTGCSFENLMFWKKNEGNQQSQKEKEEEITPEPPVTGETYSETVYFYGSYIQDIGTTAGVSIDSSQSSGQAKAALLQNDIISQMDSSKSGLLTELYAINVHTGDYPDGEGAIVQIGSGNPAKDNFNDGSLKWTSSNKITKVEVTAECYNKLPYSFDTTSCISISGTSFALKSEEEETPSFKTFSKEFNGDTKTFTLAAVDGRVFLKAVTVTWSL